MILIFILVLTLWLASSDGLLLSDLPTPAFVLDMDSLQRRVNTQSRSKSSPIPPLTLPKKKMLLVPSNFNDCPHEFDMNSDPLDIFNSKSTDAICYIHTTVIKSREEYDSDGMNVLAKIDLNPSLYSSSAPSSILPFATLVLGLNNHHVGSYYWARSAGAGASMDAPGIEFTNNGTLCWESNHGPIECNSNDGKRSEWVNFLRPGDTVQLLPSDSQETLLHFANKHGKLFGISSKKRPMGSEPKVVCKWIIQE